MFIGRWHGSDEAACTNRRHVGHACHASCCLLKQLTHGVLSHSHCFQFKYSHAIHVCWSLATFKRCEALVHVSINQNAGNRGIQHEHKIGAALH